MKSHRPKLQNPNAPSILRRRAYLSQQQTAAASIRLTAPFVAASLAALLFVGIIVWALGRLFPPDDLTGPLYSGTARVENKINFGNRYGSSTPSLYLRIQNQLVIVSTRDLQKWAFTPQGAVVPVTYRVDKHGMIHIDDWQIK